MDLIDRQAVLDALACFNDTAHGDAHFLNGIKTAREIVENLSSVGQDKPQTKGAIMIDWKRKLTSRKFWLSVASFVSMLVIAFGGTQEVSAQVSAIIIAGATVIAYIIGEGMTDQASFLDVEREEKE